VYEELRKINGKLAGLEPGVLTEVWLHLGSSFVASYRETLGRLPALVTG
jgi:hypothetical protein